jgi:hypothetical protein
LALLSFPGLVSGQEPAATGADRAERLKEMQDLVRSIRISDPARPKRAPDTAGAEPLHRWNDPTRGFSDGGIWAFGGVGRPSALVSMELYGDPKGLTNWSSELISLAPGPIVGDGEGRFVPLSQAVETAPGGPLLWEPKAAGVVAIPVPEAPKPGASESERLRQMKAIAGRITAREVGPTFGDDQKYDLRLMPRPIHRYADPASGLLDGAIFVYAYGTNPELLALIEARTGPDGKASWSCGFARLSRAKLIAGLDGKEVWTRPYVAHSAAEDEYYIVRTLRPLAR